MARPQQVANDADPPPPYTEIAGPTDMAPQPSVLLPGPPVPARPQHYQPQAQQYGYDPNYYGHSQYAAQGRLRYPAGFWCAKCHNTGYKLANRHPCRTCFQSFSTGQSAAVHVLPPPPSPLSSHYAPYVSFPPGSTVVSPGDPALGGVPCGACKGKGVVDDFGLGGFLAGVLGGTRTCPVCRGVGRLL
ncbi:hypothetical protein V1514DRAFT_335551 [Lipomyces japonicus]|uniref:uncharacterized protein n=1 Tax=Lipomyces japonicus TaxID=56871 RepID=UPI0034CD6993